MKQHMESDGIWRTRFERLFDREYDEKLALASNWKQLYKWQRASISYTGKIFIDFWVTIFAGLVQILEYSNFGLDNFLSVDRKRQTKKLVLEHFDHD